MIVHRDRFPPHPGHRRAVVAVQPTALEWDREFPYGAAGILLQDGTMVVGDGTCLSHHEILQLSGQTQPEAFRLQIGRAHCWAEIWLEGVDENSPEQEIRQQVIDSYGEPLECIARRVEEAVTRFAPCMATRAIPLGDEQECLLAGDEDFRNAMPRGLVTPDTWPAATLPHSP